MMNLNTLLPSRDDLMEEGTQQHASADNGGPVQEGSWWVSIRGSSGPGNRFNFRLKMFVIRIPGQRDTGRDEGLHQASKGGDKTTISAIRGSQW